MTIFKTNNEGFAKVISENGEYTIEYYDNKGHQFFLSDTTYSTVTEANSRAKEWADGYVDLYG